MGAIQGEPDPTKLPITLKFGANTYTTTLAEMFTNIQVNDIGDGAWRLDCLGYSFPYQKFTMTVADPLLIGNTLTLGDGEPELESFPLDNIDQMRMDILAAVNTASAFTVSSMSQAPYGLSLGQGALGKYLTKNQEGLGINISK
jgi:hypothetical protein